MCMAPPRIACWLPAWLPGPAAVTMMPAPRTHSLPTSATCCGGSTRAPVVASSSEISKLLARTDTFIFDCDGVLYTPEGPIPGAEAALAALRAAGKRCLFLTNASGMTRKQLQARLRDRHIDAAVGDVFGSAYLTACHLKQLSAQGKWAPQNKVYVSGSDALATEIRAAGFTVVGGQDDNDKAGRYSSAQMAAVQIDPDIKAVVVGADTAGTSFYKVCYCVRCLVENPGCVYILTNPDLRFPIASASAADPEREGTASSYLPAAGAMAASISACLGREPTVCGKPSSLAFELIAAEHPMLVRERTTMVGDTLYTDIAFGNSCGLNTVPPPTLHPSACIQWCTVP